MWWPRSRLTNRPHTQQATKAAPTGCNNRTGCSVCRNGKRWSGRTLLWGRIRLCLRFAIACTVMISRGTNARSTTMKVYLDDERPTPDGWRLARWPEDVIALLKTGDVTHISLDHDLGGDDRGTGYDVLLWIEQAVATGGISATGDCHPHEQCSAAAERWSWRWEVFGGRPGRVDREGWPDRLAVGCRRHKKPRLGRSHY